MHPSSANQIQVLVVGAGPTGLAAAAVLAKQGVRVRIIDKNKSRSDKSKALGVQAGTLECLRGALGQGLVDTMIKAGRPTREAFIHLGSSEGAEPIKVDLSVIPSDYNFVLILEQSETERIFEEYLNGLSVTVERETEWVDGEELDTAAISRVKRVGSAALEEIASAFVIACDGAHSAVRRSLDIPFEGGTYSGEFILGDVKLEWPWPYGSIQTFSSEKGVIASFPMKGEQRYRLVLIPPSAVADDNASREISLEEFRSLVARLSDRDIQILEATWLTRFSVHHRMVHHFQKGRFFLAGDAAHIHSPAGGQGMNTGIQDAINLGFKIKSAFLGQIPWEALSRYEKERLPVARGVLKGTNFVFKMALLPETWFVKWLRREVLPRVVRTPWIQKRVVLAISEVMVARKEIERYRANP